VRRDLYQHRQRVLPVTAGVENKCEVEQDVPHKRDNSDPLGKWEHPPKGVGRRAEVPR